MSAAVAQRQAAGDATAAATVTDRGSRAAHTAGSITSKRASHIDADFVGTHAVRIEVAGAGVVIGAASGGAVTEGGLSPTLNASRLGAARDALVGLADRHGGVALTVHGAARLDSNAASGIGVADFTGLTQGGVERAAKDTGVCNADFGGRIAVRVHLAHRILADAVPTGHVTDLAACAGQPVLLSATQYALFGNTDVHWRTAAVVVDTADSVAGIRVEATVHGRGAGTCIHGHGDPAVCSAAGEDLTDLIVGIAELADGALLVVAAAIRPHELAGTRDTGLAGHAISIALTRSARGGPPAAGGEARDDQTGSEE